MIIYAITLNRLTRERHAGVSSKDVLSDAHDGDGGSTFVAVTVERARAWTVIARRVTSLPLCVSQPTVQLGNVVLVLLQNGRRLKTTYQNKPAFSLTASSM